MSVALQCNRCGREIHSSGIRGMCPQCLFACSATRLDTQVADHQAPEGDDELASEQTVGPDNRFLLLDKLGEGGMGEVWLADDRQLSQPGEPQFVALKFLSKSIRHNPRAVDAIRAEVRRSQTLTHPNVVRIFDLHTTRTGLPFIKMEYVEGNSLSHWLRNHPDHVMPWRLVAQLTRQLASALVYAHETAGIVHRDLKPANLLFGQGSILKLSDFGLSQAMSRRGRAGDEPGGATLAYASPQQIAGAPPTPADDIYSLGATLYELLTGTPPFRADYLDDLLEKIQNATPEPIPQRLQALGRRNEVPARLMALVQRCLEKDPLYRPKTGELVRMLPLGAEPLLVENRTSAQVTAEWEDKPSRANRFAEWFWLTALILVLLAAVAWIFDLGQARERVQRGLQSLSGHFTSAGKNGSALEDASGSELSPPPSEDISVQSETNLVSPPVVLSRGWLSLNIDSEASYVFYDCEVQDRNGLVPFRWKLPQGSKWIFLTNLPAGDYLLSVTAGRTATATEESWIISRRLLIQPGATNDLRFPFRRGRLTIQTEPPRGLIKWHNANTNLGVAPFVGERFRSGSNRFTATLKGHGLVTTDYFFDPQPGRETQLLLSLPPQHFPVAGEDWTNSLGMAFKWVQEILALVAVTETRVADYRQFSRSTSNSEGATNLFTLTTNGWQQLGGSWEHPGFEQTEDHPVVGINWEDAMKFCEWLTEMERNQKRISTNQAYILPTASQWAKLVGGDKYPWGNAESELPLNANYSGREARQKDWPFSWPVLEGHTDNWPRTAPVIRQGPQTRTGLYDLAGNAAEWCLEKELCGGSWFDGELYDSESKHLDCLKTTHVGKMDPSRRDPRNGFRVIIPLGEPSRPSPKP